MEWIDRLNASLNYIEEHLTEEIRIEELARIACCSSYHYQRMFTYIAGIPNICAGGGCRSPRSSCSRVKSRLSTLP